VVNPSKRKGTGAETAIVGALIDAGWPHAERRALHGSTDKGDVAGLPGVCIEAKAEKTYDIQGWLREVQVEQANANADVGVCWFKLRGKTDPMQWAVVMTGRQFTDLLRQAGY
jgi:hypothetical protein